MSSVQEIEAAIQTLPSRDQDELFSWIEKQYALQFDSKLERDAQSGALDRLIDRALAEAETGKVRDL